MEDKKKVEDQKKTNVTGQAKPATGLKNKEDSNKKEDSKKHR